MDDGAVLEAARSEISHSSCGGLPTVVDPFCGSGTIALEALRLGLNAIGCDLNPIAVAISKALVEVPHVVSGHRPINPKPDQLCADTWGGSMDFVPILHITRSASLNARVPRWMDFTQAHILDHLCQLLGCGAERQSVRILDAILSSR
jgi:DNA methylase